MKYKSMLKMKGRILAACILALGTAVSSTGVSAASIEKEQPVISYQMAESQVHTSTDQKNWNTADILRLQNAVKSKKKTEDDEKIKIPSMKKKEKNSNLLTNGCYAPPYLFRFHRTTLNIEEGGLNGLDRYDASNHIKVKLSDKKSVTVYWADPCLSYMKDTDVLDALTQVLIKLNAVYKKASMSLKEIMLSDVTDIGDQSLEELEENFYEEDNGYFTILFPLLKEKDQKKFFKKMIEDENGDYYICIDYASAKIANYCAEIAYKNDDVCMFSEAVPYLSKKAKASWKKRCEEDDAYCYTDEFTD